MPSVAIHSVYRCPVSSGAAPSLQQNCHVRGWLGEANGHQRGCGHPWVRDQLDQATHRIQDERSEVPALARAGGAGALPQELQRLRVLRVHQLAYHHRCVRQRRLQGALLQGGRPPGLQQGGRGPGRVPPHIGFLRSRGITFFETVVNALA